jgi:hypothetical protein
MALGFTALVIVKKALRSLPVVGTVTSPLMREFSVLCVCLACVSLVATG